MATGRRNLAIGGLMAALIAPAVAGIEPTVGAAAANQPTLSIATLGYRDGIDFSGFEGHRDLYFRVPAGVPLVGAHLVLPYGAAAASTARRTLNVMAGGRVLGQVALGGDGVADIPVPADAIDGGTLRATLVYSGGESANRCLDRRAGADHLHIAPEAGLALAPGTAASVGAAIALLGRRPTVILPASPSPQQAAAALTVLAARGGGTLATSGGPGAVRIGAVGDPALRATPDGLVIGGKDPAAAARAAFAGYADLLAAPAIDRLVIAPHRDARLRFADLGADPRATMIDDDGGWTIALPASRLPAGKTIRGLSIDVAAVPDGSARGASVSAWLNGTLLGSAPLDPDGVTHLGVDVPRGLVHTLNGIEVRITREQRADCGDVPRGWPAQLLGSSEVLLGKSGPVEDFHDFAAASGAGLTVALSGPADLPLAGRAIAGLVGGDVPIRVVYGQIPAGDPILYVGATPPPGTTPPLAFAQGRMTFAAKGGIADLDLPDTGTQAVAQLLSADGRPILWLRPARQGAVPATLWLDQGDVALAAADGTITPLSSRHDRLSPLAGPAAPSWWSGPAGKWGFAMIGLLIGVAIVVWSFRPSVKRSRPGQSS